MKKHIGGYKLNRDSSARLALMKNLVYSLIQHEEITTTKTKARAVTPIFEKLITRAKVDSVQNRRLVQAYVQEGSLVTKLFGEIAPRYQTILGGYTKLTPVGNRRGDSAAMAKLSLTKKKPASTTKAKVEEATVPTKKAAKITAVTPEKVSATKAAPKVVRRTGKRGDK